MTAPDALDLNGAAALLGVTYDWLQRHWRTLPGFPPPYLGGGKGQRPRWARAAIDEYKMGRRWSADALAPQALSHKFSPANDAVRAPISDPVAALLAAAGG